MTKSSFYNRSQMVARWATSLATLYWGVLVVSINGSLDRFPMLDYLPEQAWGSMAIFMGLLQVVRTVRASPPCLFGHVCNFAMCVLWTWVMIRVASTTTEASLVAFALPPSAILCCLSWINFGAIPKFDLKEERRQWTSFFRG